MLLPARIAPRPMDRWVGLLGRAMRTLVRIEYLAPLVTLRQLKRPLYEMRPF